MPKRRANGEGNIRKRKDGRWEGRYTVGHDPETGKAIIKNVLGKTQAEVKEKLKKAIEENVGIDYGRAKTYTVGNWLEVWYENYAKIKMRPSTYLTYHGYIENHIKPQLGKIPLNDLTTLHLQQLYKKLLAEGRVERIEAQKQPKGLSAKTVRNIHQIISSALKLAVEQRLIARNPADGCALPKAERKEMQTLPVEQLTSFLREAKDSGVFALYYIDLTTGLRRGELLGLKWSDIDLEKGDLRVQRQIGRIDGKIIEMPPKTKNAYRTLPLSADAISVLMQQRRKTGNSEWVFPSPTGGPMSPDSVLHMLHRVLKRAGLPEVRFHDLRHPYVKHMTKIFSLRLMDFQAQAYNSFERLPPPMPISISSIVCSGSFLFLEKSFPGTFTHASKFAAVFFIAWNNADRTRSGYDFLFTWKASLKNVIIFKAKPSIFIDLSSVFLRNIAFICPPVLK